MGKRDDRVKLWLEDDWFNELMEVLQKVRAYHIFRLEQTDTSEEKFWEAGLTENKRLVDKIIRYAWYEESPDGKKEARMELFPSEARDLIWQLLVYAVLFTDTEEALPEGVSHYEEYKAKHEAFKNGQLVFPETLRKGAARELYNLWRIGYEYLVKNKDGSCYAVDHGCSGVPVKREDRWEDPEYGFDENVFLEMDRGFNIVSWEDEKPLDIGQHLRLSGWVSLIDGEYQFLGDRSAVLTDEMISHACQEYDDARIAHLEKQMEGKPPHQFSPEFEAKMAELLSGKFPAEEKKGIDPGVIAIQLWDLGYHASDRDKLIEEFQMTDEQVDAICKTLQYFEDREDAGF